VRENTDAREQRPRHSSRLGAHARSHSAYNSTHLPFVVVVVVVRAHGAAICRIL
jgi:hypothetical protein